MKKNLIIEGLFHSPLKSIRNYFKTRRFVEKFKELGYDVQKGLSVIEEESKKLNSTVKQKKTGFFTNIIAHILKFLYAGKAKTLYNKINNDPRLIESNKKLEQARANYIKTIGDPSVKEAFKKYGYDIEKDFLHYSDIIKPKNKV